VKRTIRTEIFERINSFKKGINLELREKLCHLPAPSHNIFNIWKNYFVQLLNVSPYNVTDVRQSEMLTDKPLSPQLGFAEIRT
jgi:hypothetical protein